MHYVNHIYELFVIRNAFRELNRKRRGTYILIKSSFRSECFGSVHRITWSMFLTEYSFITYIVHFPIDYVKEYVFSGLFNVHCAFVLIKPFRIIKTMRMHLKACLHTHVKVLYSCYAINGKNPKLRSFDLRRI